MKKILFLIIFIVNAINGIGQHCDDFIYGLNLIENLGSYQKVNYVKINTSNGDATQLSPIIYSFKPRGIAGIINNEYYFAIGEGFNVDQIVFLDLETGQENRRIDIFGSAIHFTSTGCGTLLYGFVFDIDASYFSSINIYTGEITLSSHFTNGLSGNVYGTINDEYYYVNDNGLVFVDLNTSIENRTITTIFNTELRGLQSPGTGNLLYEMRQVNGLMQLYNIDIYTGVRNQLSNQAYQNVELYNVGIKENEFYFQIPQEGVSSPDTLLVFIDLETGEETKRVDLHNKLYKNLEINCNPICPCTDNSLTYPNPYIIPNGTDKWIKENVLINGNTISVKVENGSTVNIRAEEEIEILPQFEIELGSVVLLDIQACF